MSDDGIIQHAAATPFLVLRTSYISICKGNQCAAALLGVLEQWMNYNIKAARKEKRDPQLWIFRTRAELSADMMELFKSTAIGKAIILLRELGFIETRRNPERRWDATLQYLLDPVTVQRALETLQAPSRDAKNDTSRRQKRRLEKTKTAHRDAKNTQAIQQTIEKTIEQTMQQKTARASDESNAEQNAPIENIQSGEPPPLSAHPTGQAQIEISDRIIALLSIITNPDEKRTARDAAKAELDTIRAAS